MQTTVKEVQRLEAIRALKEMDLRKLLEQVRKQRASIEEIKEKEGKLWATYTKAKKMPGKKMY